ncbi:hypothetical protein ACFX19_002426 [Malus domestica]
MDVEQPVPEEVEQKLIQNLSHGMPRSTRFKRTKRKTERVVPFRPVPFYVPNAPQRWDQPVPSHCVTCRPSHVPF